MATTTGPVSSTQEGPWRPAMALIALSLFWGYTWVLTKQALAYAPPFAFAAHRLRRRRVGAVPGAGSSAGRCAWSLPAGKTLAIALVNVAAYLIFQTWALVDGGAGKTAVLNYTMPFWMLLMAWPLLGERIRLPQWMAAFCALAGLTLIIEPWDMHTSQLSKFLGLAGAVCWAVGSVLVKRLRSQCEVDLISLTAWQLLMGAVPLLLLAFLVPDRPTAWSATYVGILSFISIVSTALCWWLWTHILDRVPAWQASLSVLGAPVVALLSSRWLLGERFQVAEVLGMLLIGVGLALLTLLGWMARRRVRSPSERGDN
ncbi:MAG: DMT family transporter [Betaproteobacteria bacterium]|nr:DMT family transporter [Betaproteobacteria bacterium]